MAEYRVKVVGAGGVGKSALTIKFIQGTFVEKYDPTIEDSYRKQIDVDGFAVMLDITDTAGQEEYSQIRDELLEDGHGFIIVYSITDPASFDEVSSLYESILKTKNKDEGIPCILAGNKVDLEEERAVPREQAEELVKTMGGLCKFYETSAKAEPSLNVKEIFEELVRLVNQKEMSTESQSNEPSAPEKNGKSTTKQNSNPTEKKAERRKKTCNIL